MTRWLATWGVSALVVVLVGCASDEPDPSGLRTHVDDWRDEIIYQIVVDRFANADQDNDVVGGIGPIPDDLARFQGGDWAGIRANLDYIEALGVTTLWISPINANVQRTDYQDGYHGYWTSDFARLNQRFGDIDELRGLVDDAHARGMKLIIDIVPNHTGRVFYYDLDEDETVDSGELEPSFFATGAKPEHIQWLMPPPRLLVGDDPMVEPLELPLTAMHFHRRGQTTDDSQSQKELGDFPTGLRDLDTENDEVIDGLIDTFAYWVEQTDIDGFRLDAIPHAPHAFWSRLADGLRERLSRAGKDKFLLLGEVFNGEPAKLASYTGAGGLDSVFDFSFKGAIVDSFILDGNPGSTVRWALDQARQHYPTAPHSNGVGLDPWQARVSFASNHDVPRLRYWLDDPFAAELAMTAVFTVDAIPAVYYGTEQELAGGWGNESREVLWDTGYRRDTRMFRHLARLADIRKRSAALRRGDLRVRYASEISARESGPGAGLLAWERFTSDDRVLVALNSHPIDNARVTVCTGFAEGDRLVDYLATSDVQLVVGTNGCVDIEVQPRRAVILGRRR